LDGINLNDALLRYYQGVEKRPLRTSTIAGERTCIEVRLLIAALSCTTLFDVPRGTRIPLREVRCR